MKNWNSLKLKIAPKMNSSHSIGRINKETPKKDREKLIQNTSGRKKKNKDILNENIKNIIPFNLNNNILSKFSLFHEKSIFHIPPNPSKEIINQLIMKKIDKVKFIERIKLVKYKLYENHGRPYINVKYNLKSGEIPPLYYDYYKINKILLKHKCKLVSKYNDLNIFFNENEYLIRYSPRKEFYILMKYLLFFVYGYDRLTFSKKCQQYYDLKEVKSSYETLLSIDSKEEEGNNIITTNIKTSVSRKDSANNFSYSNNFLNNNFSIKNISESAKINPLIANKKRLMKRHSIDFGFISNKGLLLNTNSKRRSIIDFNFSKPKVKKLKAMKEYFVGLGGENNLNLISCKLKTPNYILIANMPFKSVPNCVPNLYPLRIFYFNIMDNYMLNLGKLKLNLYPNNKEKKQTKKIWWNVNEKDYREFTRKLSFSSEDFYKENGKEIYKNNIYYNHNRRLKNDNDINDIENIIIEIEKMEKNIENCSSMSSSNNSDDDLSSNLNENEYIDMKHNFKDSKKQKINDKINKKKPSILSFKSNNFHSSTSSSGNIKGNINEKNFGETNKINNIKNNNKLNKEKEYNINIEKENEQNFRDKILENKKSLFIQNFSNKKDNIILKKNLLKKEKNFNIEINDNKIKKGKINLFKSTNKLNKNKKIVLSIDKNKNKMKLLKHNNRYNDNKNIEYMPYLTDKNSKKDIFSPPKIHSFDYKNTICNPHSKKLSGNYSFKTIYEFNAGKNEETNKFKYKMNLIKAITTDFQKNIFLSKYNLKNKKAGYFPSLDFLISCRMKRKRKAEEGKNDYFLYKNKFLTIQSMNS